MASPTGTLNEVKSALDLVIQSLIDGQKGFQELGELLKDESLHHYFLAESLNRAAFRGELETILHQEGVHDIKEGGTVTGTITRTWGDLKSRLGGGDHALLAAAEENEDATLSTYNDIMFMDSLTLPLPIRQLLTRQATHIAEVHDYIREARDTRK